MTDIDLTKLLADWPYQAGRINARLIEGESGREKLQVRVELGVLQMELEGRPDGRKPHGSDSELDHQLERLRNYEEATGASSGFVVSPPECQALREEAVQYYHRYVALMVLGEYERVRQDVLRNLKLLDLCRDYAAADDDQAILEQFRPHLVAMRARSEAEMAVAGKQPRSALDALDRGLDELRVIYEEAGQPEAYDASNEVQLLRGMRDTLVPKLPSSQRHELEERLRAAIAAENFELAAILRDELRMMKGS